MKTLLLGTDTWDLVKDANGNIAVASEPYAYAQDAASEIKLFQGEAWYDTARGIPYWARILGKAPPVAVMKAYFVAAALRTPGVVSAKCFITRIAGRVVTGQVQVSDKSGVIAAAGF